MAVDTTIRSGYKKTELGLIPVDWDIKKLSEIVDFKNGKAHENFISDDGNYIVVNSKFISSEGKIAKYSNKCFCPAPIDSVLMVMSDVPNGRAIAKCFLVDVDNKYTVNQRICILKPKVDPRYLFYKINRNPYYLSFDDGVKQTNLRKNDVLGCKLDIPNKKAEQTAIAAVLSDTDILIDRLDKLINKKKAIKQGAMQELLTGKKRLPGFSGVWVKNTLENCTKRIIVGLATSVTKYYRKNGVILLRNLNIKPNKLDEAEILYLDRSFADNQTSKMIKAGDVLTVHTGYVGISCIVPKKFENCLTFTTLITTTNQSVLKPKFLMYHLNSSIGAKEIELLQSGGGRNNLNVNDFIKYHINYPSEISEQLAITNVLDSMSIEIESLERKRDKYQMIKQGMMQQLLTGKIRIYGNG